MQAILKLIQAFLWAWDFAKKHPKSATATAAAGLTGGAMMFSSITTPPALITAANTTNAPGSNGQVLESNGDNTYTFGEPGGVGGGATELAELDDVSDTLAGAQGDFLGWDGADWDDIEVTFDTATDVTITTPATKQTVRYNGSGWVNSQLASTDLSDFSGTIVGDSNDILAWNGSAFDDTPFVTAVTSAFGNGTDNYVLTADGVGGVAWEAASGASVDATGITDGYVYTADGDATPAWEAPAVGGLLTPDGATAVTNTRRFNPYDYKASGSRRIEYVKWSGTGPTTWSTRTAADAARNHDYTVGMGVALHGAGDACTVSTPAVTGVNATVTRVGAAITWTYVTTTITTSRAAPVTTGDPVRFTTTTTLPTGVSLATTYYLRKLTATTFSVHATANDANTNTSPISLSGGSGTHTVDGYTQWDVQFVATDGNGGATAASTAVSTRGWKIPALWTADYFTHTVPVPYGAASVAIYGAYDGGTNQLLTILDCVKGFNSAGTLGALSTDPKFTGISDAGGGSITLTGVTDVAGLAANDYINIKCSSSGDTVYDVRALVTNVNSGAATVTVTVAYDGTATTAAGSFRRGTAAWHFKGMTPPLHTTKYMPDVENPVYDWRASSRVWQGQLCVDSAGGRLWRCIRSVGTGLTGTVEPTWAAAPDTVLVDNEVTWALEAAFLPVNAPSSAQRQTLITTIATVPTSSTFTTAADAQGGDVASIRLVCVHNDLKAFRDCLTAMKTYNRPAVFEISAGDYQLQRRKQTNTSDWTSADAVNVQSHSTLQLNSGVDNVAFPRFSVVADPGAIIRVRDMQSRMMVEDLVVGGSTETGASVFINQQTDDAMIQGGEWEWAPAAAGLTEHDCAWSYNTGNSWLGGKRFLAEDGATAVGLTVRDVIVHWPNIATSLSSITNANGAKLGRQSWLNCRVYYGGGDGDFNQTPYGEFLWDGGEIRNVRRLGSVGLYFGSYTYGVKVANCTIRDVFKYAIQIRAAGGDAYSKSVQIEDVEVVDSGPMILGDQTSDNPNYSCTLTNVNGASLQVAEMRDFQIIGGTYKTIQLLEDNKRGKIVGITCESLDLRSSNASFPNTYIEVTDVTVHGLFGVGNCSYCTFTNVNTLNSASRTTSLVRGDLKWTQKGSTGEYYVTLQDGTTAGFSTPTANDTVLWIGDTVSMGTGTTGSGTLGSLAAGQWTYGDPDTLGFSTYTVKTLDSDAPDPDGNQNGYVFLGSVTNSTAGVIIDNTLTQCRFSKCNWIRTDSSPTAVIGTTGGASTPTLSGVFFDDCVMDVQQGNYLLTSYVIDLLTTALPGCELYFNRCKFKLDWSDTIHSPLRCDLAKGGNITFSDCDLRYWGSAPVITNAFGQVHVLNCRVQSSEMLATANASADTLIGYGGAVAWADGTSHRFFMRPTPASANPGSITHGTEYWHCTANNKVYDTKINADAGGATGLVDITSNATVTVVVPDCARAATGSVHEFLGDLTNFDSYGRCLGNTIRSSDSWTPADIGADTNNYQLIPLINRFRITTTGSSRAITGFDAPAGGMYERRIQIDNVGGQNITYPHLSGSSSENNQFSNPGGLTITQTPGSSCIFEYDLVSFKWRLVHSTAGVTVADYDPQYDVLPLRRVAQWAIEPKRIQLALAA